MSVERPNLQLTREQLAELLHGYVDLVLELQDNEASDPVLGSLDAAKLSSQFGAGLPQEGMDAKELLAELKANLVPNLRKNGHPRFLGYVCASVDPIGAVFEGLSAFMNQNLTAWRSAPGAVSMERQVLAWIDHLVGFGSEGQGLLTSGGSMANATAMACALHGAADRMGNPLTEALPRLTAYVSSETHASMAKACRVFGLPQQNVRFVKVDSGRRMDLQDLLRNLEKDIREGFVPACVCASAGTVNTGAVDPLLEIAELCEQQDVWLHVDGAYGGPVSALEEHGEMRSGFARAKSLSIDPHKWLFAPMGVGCLLLREDADARAVFRLEAEYTAVEATGSIESHAFFDLGFELSRPNRALKVWAILKARGARVLVQEIRRHIQLRESFDQMLSEQPRIELLGSGLSVSSFRWCPSSALSLEQLNQLNRKLLAELVDTGRFFLSPTTLEGRYALRICIVNFRTQVEDLQLLLDEVLRIGAGLAAD